MKFIIDHIFLFAIVIISGGFLWPLLSMRGKRATVLEVTQLINGGKTIIVDVRSAENSPWGHLPDAKNMPLPERQNAWASWKNSKRAPL